MNPLPPLGALSADVHHPEIHIVEVEKGLVDAGRPHASTKHVLFIGNVRIFGIFGGAIEEIGRRIVQLEIDVSARIGILNRWISPERSDICEILAGIPSL